MAGPGPLLLPFSQWALLRQTFLFQFDVIDNIMCLDDVLGFINPETQMPNTVLLAGVGWGRVSEEGGRGPTVALNLGRTKDGSSPRHSQYLSAETSIVSIESNRDKGPGPSRVMNPEMCLSLCA